MILIQSGVYAFAKKYWGCEQTNSKVYSSVQRGPCCQCLGTSVSLPAGKYDAHMLF